MEIKIRAWDTYTKKMICTGFHVLGEVTAFSAIEAYCYSNPSKELHLVRLLNDIILMLYTGLIDKNGQEIYKNDIIEFNDTEIGGKKGYGVVTYFTDLTLVDAPCFALMTKDGYYQMPMNRTVIGNDLENPELLEELK